MKGGEGRKKGGFICLVEQRYNAFRSVWPGKAATSRIICLISRSVLCAPEVPPIPFGWSGPVGFQCNLKIYSKFDRQFRILRHGVPVVLKLFWFAAYCKTYNNFLAHFVYKIKNILIYFKLWVKLSMQMGFYSFLTYTFIIFAAHLTTSCGAPFENHCGRPSIRSLRSRFPFLASYWGANATVTGLPLTRQNAAIQKKITLKRQVSVINFGNLKLWPGWVWHYACRWLPPSILKMEASGSSEAWITTYQTARYHSPKEHNLNLYRR
jgi:hypothetical protein